MSTTVQYRSNAVLHETAGAEAAFLRLRPKYVALRSTQLAYFNLAMHAALSTLRAVVPKVQELRPALAQLYEFNITAADELSDATLGLEYAHSQVMIRTHPSDDLEDLNREAIQTRDRFLHDQENLAKNGVIDPHLLSQSTGSTGYKSVVTDIRTCIAVYRAIGAPGAAKSCCTVEDIDRAEGVIRLMERLIGLRKLGSSSAREWLDWRARAFTLAFNDYGEVRRGVTYLRWHHGDVDTIAPSLYKGRTKKRRSTPKSQSPESEAANPEAAKAPTPQPVIGPNGPFVQASSSSVAPTPAHIPGMPGGSPFIQ